MKAPAILPQGFYVYTHHRESTGEIFYVGKGNGKRAWDATGRSRHWRSILKAHGVLVSILNDQLTEAESFNLEKKTIAYWGRKDLGLGLLINLTDGGEGASGYKQKEDEKLRRTASILRTYYSGDGQKRKSESIKKSWQDNNIRARRLSAMAITMKSDAYRKKCSDSQKIAQNKPEQKKKLSDAMMLRNTDPVDLKKRGDAIALAKGTEKARLDASKKTRITMSDPDVKERHRQSLIRHWQERKAKAAALM